MRLDDKTNRDPLAPVQVILAFPAAPLESDNKKCFADWIKI